MKVDLPDDVIRMARLAARLGGEELEEWLGNLVRHHVDTAPLPEWPLVIEALTEAAALEPAKPAANEPPEDPAGHIPPKTAPKTAPKPREEEVDDATLLLRTAHKAGLLDDNREHVIATELRELMHAQHGWSNSPQGSRRIAEALQRVAVQRLPRSVPVEEGGTRTAFPAQGMRRALARRKG